MQRIGYLAQDEKMQSAKATNQSSNVDFADAFIGCINKEKKEERGQVSYSPFTKHKYYT